MLEIKLGTGNMGISTVMNESKTRAGITLTSLENTHNIGDKIGKRDNFNDSLIITSDNLKSFDVIIEACEHAKEELIEELKNKGK